MANGVAWFLAGTVLGAVVGGVSAALVVPASPQAADDAAPQASADRFGRAFEDAMTRALRRVQTEGRAARAPDAAAERGAEPAAAEQPGPPAPSEPRPGRALRPGEEVVQRPPAAHAAEPHGDTSGSYARDASTALRAKDLGRLERMIVRKEADEGRRSTDWLFVSEASVAGHFGVPDVVRPQKDGTEIWEYRIPFRHPDGEDGSLELDFIFSRGRVIEVGGADAIPDEEE